MDRRHLRPEYDGNIQVDERWRYPASTQTAATASLGFGNDNPALVRSPFGKPSGASVGGVDFRKVIEFRSETSGCQAVLDLLELERSFHPRRPLFIIRLKNAHSS